MNKTIINRKTRQVKMIAVTAMAAIMIVFSMNFARAQSGNENRMGAGNNDQMKKKQAMCEKTPDVCDLMKEAMDFCQESGAYCEMSGLPKMEKPAGDSKGGPGMGGPGGGGPGGGGPGAGGPGGGRGPGMGGPGGGGGGPRMGGQGGESGGKPNEAEMKKKMGVVGEMMEACMSGSEKCKTLKTQVKEKLAFSKGMKTICEGKGKDKDACGLIKEMKTFCNEDINLCKEASLTDVQEPKYYADFLKACPGDKDKCGDIKTGMGKKLADMKSLKKACSKDGNKEECGRMKKLMSTCASDDEKCEMSRKVTTICKDDPEECGRLKQEQREKDVEDMKMRCDKNPDVCKTNIAQKRNFCNEKPADCDEDTIYMLDEMETHISQM